MKKIIVVSVLFFLLAMSCSNQKQATISGTITLSDDLLKDDNIYVGLYQMGFEPYFGDTLQLSIQEEPHFKFNVKPGKYTLMAMTYHSERFRIPLIVQDNTTHIKINVKIPAKGLDPNFDAVYIKGGFNNWTVEETSQLTKEGNVWVFKDTSRIEPGDYYDFYINGTTIHDLANPNINFVQHWGSFNGQYKGGAILFDPSLYKTPREKPIVEIEGFAHHQQLERLQVALSEFRTTIWEPMRQPGKRDADFYKHHYERFNRQLDSLARGVDPYFTQSIQESRILVVNYHPIQAELRKLYTEKADSLRRLEFYKSDLYSTYFKEMLTLLGSFDPNSILLNGDFANLALSLQRYLELYPHVGEKFQLDQNYFVDYLLDFEKETQNEECAASILYSLGYYYTNQDDFDNAKDILLYFKKKYPTNYYVANGIIDKNLASLKIRPGFKAPEFSIRTLDGDSLRLSDFQGKFLLIDFWGTWCGPCRGEIPHLKKLFANMPQDTFALLGIARDDSSSLRKYIEEENILYPNAIAPEEVLNRFGITGYPTTLLIDPQGQIIGKNLRGSNIEDLVRGKMNEYNKMSTI